MTDLFSQFFPLFVYSLSPSVRDCLIKMTRRVEERGSAPNLPFYDGALEDADQRRADIRRRGVATLFYRTCHLSELLAKKVKFSKFAAFLNLLKMA